MSNNQAPKALETAFTKTVGCRYPIIAGPMFLVSDEKLVAAVSNAGGLGAMPSLNWRSTAEFRAAVEKVRALTDKPFAVNLIVNKSAPRVDADLDVCAEFKVPVVVTSLGSPKKVIEKMHAVGSKVLCDVTTLKYAKKVEALGADGVVAVCAGAGGHAGETSPLVFIPHLKRHLKIPIVAAGGIVRGDQMAAVLMLGASAVQIGTRFIASTEANVHQDYKNAIVNAEPEDIVLTRKLSGVPASVIRTPYIEKIGVDLNPIESFLHKHEFSKRAMKMLRFYLGKVQLEKAVTVPTWKQVWGAGQGAGLIDQILPAGQIVHTLMNEYYSASIPAGGGGSGTTGE
ncbi:MAG: nitronate monooxygenase [Bdellovibrionales bacterium]|nr:nitronate monooxygenase [Bdellovibrionales bacterium]